MYKYGGEIEVTSRTSGVDRGTKFTLIFKKSTNILNIQGDVA